MVRLVTSVSHGKGDCHIYLGFMCMSLLYLVALITMYTCIVHASCINLYKICTKNRLTFKLVKILEHLSEFKISFIQNI